jgi:anthranilate 1,2-dioxygenase large subunit
VIYREELARIFYGPYWHPVAHRAELTSLNSFKTTWLGELPLLVTRGADDRVRAFVNTCTHRGTMLEQQQCGVAEKFECPYHRWLFSNVGSFLGAPGREDFRADFDEKDRALCELRVADLGGLIFVTRSASTPALETFLGDCAQHLRDCMMDDGRLTLLGYQKVIYRANWKIYFDNDLYHVPLLHKGFMRMVSWRGGSADDGQGPPIVKVAQPVGHFSLAYQAAPYEDNGYLDDPTVADFKGSDARARLVNLRPVTIVSRHLDTINVRFARPLAVDRTEVHYAFFGHESDSEELARHRVRQASNILGPSGFVSIEDAAVFHRQQRTVADGLPSSFVRGTDRGPEEASMRDEIANVTGWAHYREVMGLDA